MSIRSPQLLTIANGNWRSIKSDMAGKITAEVNVLVPTAAATANELKATRTRTVSEEGLGGYKVASRGIPVQSVVFKACKVLDNGGKIS
jgi:hypothetical protein